MARDLTAHFKRRTAALNVTAFEALCDLVVLEQFRNILPDPIATYINEKNLATASAAAALADEFVLLHKGNFRERAAARCCAQ